MDLPLSYCTTMQSASMEDISVASSDSESRRQEPNWPRSWRAYACWLGCFFLMFNSWGLVNAYGTFASYYVGHSLRGNDQLELNLIGSTESFLVLLFSAPIGRLLDAGHFRIIIVTGAFLVSFGMFMLSIAHPQSEDAPANYAHIWVTQGFVVGLGMACYFVSSSQVAATWFPNRKGLAIGFVACGASVAGVVYPTMTRYLIDAMGFVNAVRCVAGLVTITSIFSLVFSTPNPAHNHPKPQSYRKLKTWIDTEAFRNKAFCWFMAAVAFLFLGFYPVFFNLEEWASVSGYGTRDGATAQIKNVSSTNKPLQTFWLLTIMNGASTVGRVTMAAFSDKTGSLNMHICAQLISSILILVLWSLAGSTTAAIAFCIFFGMTSGAVIGLPPASVANILGCTYNTLDTKHIGHSKLGQWTGMMYSAAAIPSLVGPVVTGHLVTQYSTYITVQCWAGASLFISALCMIFARWHLPCVDGELVSVKLARKLGRYSPAAQEKGKSREDGFEYDTDNELNRDMSGAATGVQSTFVSRPGSSKKVDQVHPVAPRVVLRGSDANV
ncbi:major facilitator superfamily domain-containing protein [Clohesyomyces aquaticus]|uniref:Major facilitator superfamily domain-containing protein n=1 Tax=Clohesyomyces aquaticus TaxID=1231657 RepID=A0A1Y1ZHK4_9PLEO|nr:major facilitator superfamily domain-containing protein [Clohesyomyces aquaticus]